MKFYRENSRLVSRLFVNQIGMTIFGVVLTLAVMKATENNTSLTVAVSIFSILFYLCLIYNVMWEEGARNIIRIKAGRLENDRFHAIKAAFLASVPNLVLAALLLISFVLAFPFDLAFAKSVYAALHIILGLFEAMYVGLFSVILELVPEIASQSFLACGLYIVSSLPMMLVAVLSYHLGMKNIYIFGKPTAKKKVEK